jgi:hypothetical protein
LIVDSDSKVPARAEFTSEIVGSSAEYVLREPDALRWLVEVGVVAGLARTEKRTLKVVTSAVHTVQTATMRSKRESGMIWEDRILPMLVARIKI